MPVRVAPNGNIPGNSREREREFPFPFPKKMDREREREQINKKLIIRIFLKEIFIIYV
jgi:hypothetical protein